MSKLFEPTQLKHLDLQNRVVMAPMTKKKKKKKIHQRCQTRVERDNQVHVQSTME
ncbi:hypothetical protein [Vibrio vulnificus]|uniref:hypothetical protein n=1 Tax=Vibrio vulnificus TaxID=672 RepID=UPI003266F82E